MERAVRALTLASFLLAGFFFAPVAVLAACGDGITGGTGTAGDPYLISTPAELAAMGSCLGSGNVKYFALENDIDLNVSPYNSGSGWTPIGSSVSPFYGSLDGNGYAISNLFINSATGDAGLFGRLYQGTTTDLRLLNVNITTGGANTGGVVGYSANSYFENVTISGTITNTSGGYVGGLNGRGSVRVTNATSTAAVSHTGTGSNVGSFSGYFESNSVVTGAYASGTASGYSRVGGLVGVISQSTVTNSGATGSVSASQSGAGGFAGHSYNATVSNSYASGTVTGGSSVGGFAGFVQSPNTFTCIYSTSDISGSSRCGGFGGYVENSTGSGIAITDSYFRGDVACSPERAGVAAYANKVTLTRVYATGAITGSGTGDVGGLVGEQGAFNLTVTDSYWDTQTTGLSTTANNAGTGTTTAAMKSASTYNNWDFSSVWAIDGSNNDGYPYLRFQSFADVTAPTISSLTPADNATAVAASANLVIEFSEPVTVGSGTVTIYRESDDSVVESINVSGGQVSGTGTDTITINPASDLPGSTSLYVQVSAGAFEDITGNAFAGLLNATAWSFTTADATAPGITSLAVGSIAPTTATVTWATDEAASTKVVYSTGLAYELSTVEANVSPRVTSHTVLLSNLAQCTTYNLKAVSADAESNYATSTRASFTTLGCPGYVIPSSATTSPVTVSATATSSLALNSQTLSVLTPENFTATSSDVVIQIRSQDAASTLQAIGIPSGKTRAGEIVFDVKALINGDEELDSFDIPVTITYDYSDDDVSGLVESSLWLYHYHNSAWDALDDCSLDTSANSITCTSPSFSIFGLFGDAASEESESSGSVLRGTSIQGRVNNLLSLGLFDKAEALKAEWPHLFGGVSLAALQARLEELKEQLAALQASNAQSLRDLQKGMEGDDVRSLQSHLISLGYSIPAGATGYFGEQTKKALMAYQIAAGIYPAAGYYGPITRAKINSGN